MARACFVAMLSLVASCQATPDFLDPPPPSRPSLGELVFRIARQNLRTAEACSAEYVSAIEPHHADFALQFDHTISRDIQNAVPDLLGGTIVPLVTDGRLPMLVHQLADAFALLVSDTFDPDRETLHALANLANARTLLESAIPLELASRVLADPEIAERVHLMAQLAQEHDGVTYVLDDVLGVLAAALDPAPVTCSGFDVDIQNSVLRTNGFVDDPAYELGTPAWMVRPDRHGNPRVLVDATTQLLAAPFIDRDGDGDADVDADGRPIDATGAVIDIPWLRGDGARDSYRRALNGNGGLLYDYYDVKRTALSYSTQLGADLLDQGIQHDLPPIVHAILGEPAVCDDGTATCRYYPSADHPLADAVYLGFELAKLDGAPQLTGVMQRLLNDDPAKGEQLLVALADIVTAFRASTLSITDPGLLDVAIGLMPLLDQLFTVDNTTGASTPRLLVDLIHDLGADRAAVPRDLAYVIQYQRLTRPSGGAMPIGTLAVDYNRTRFYQNGSAWVDNRSALEQMVELMAYSDCGYLGRANGALSINNLAYVAVRTLFGDIAEGSVSHVVIDVVSRQSPATASSLIGLINAFNNLGGVAPVIRAVGCSAAQASATAAHFDSLQTLATSGGLDWLLPIARVFREQGQLRTVIDMFKQLAVDLWLDGQYNAPRSASVSVVRRLESPLLSAIHAGAVDKLMDALELMYGIPAGTSDRAAYLALDVIARAVATHAVMTRTGPVERSSVALELMKAARTMVVRLNAAGADENLSHAIGLVLDQFATRGTTNRVMANPNLRMLAVSWLQVARDASELSNAQYVCYVSAVQVRAVDALTQRHFATLVRVLEQLNASPNAAALERWLLSMVRGQPGEPTQEVYGPLLQLLAGAASSDLAGADLSKLAHWASGVAAQNASAARGLVETFDDLLASDRAGALLQISRNLVDPGPIASAETPAETFGRAFADVARIDEATSCAPNPTVTAERLESTVQSLVTFFSDDVNGISSIWRLVGAIAPAPEGP